MTSHPHFRRPLIAALLLLIQINNATRATPATQPVIDPRDAAAVFELAKHLSDRDGGRLWGRALYGPMLLVDPATRFVVANQKDAKGELAQSDDLPNVFTGTLSDGVGIANTATDWAGVRWTMVMWPIPDAPASRGRLVMHELYHRIQDDIGLPATNPSNNHLDTRDGRVFLRLEWRALAATLLAETDTDRAAAARDAIRFRRHRQSLFATARANEAALEMNEGLAEYTGYRLCGLPAWAVRDRVVLRLADQEQQSSYVRNFAYVSGPAYALLLDDARPDWRTHLTPQSDLSELLAAAMKLDLPRDDELKSAAVTAADRYRGAALFKAEDERAANRERRLAEVRRRFVDSPVLILPLSPDVNYTYDPNGISAVDDQASVYQTCHITDAFGQLDVTGDALIVRKDGRVAEARVVAPPGAAAPTAALLRGEGWTLKLSEGWKVAPGPRPGDLVVTRDGQ